MIARLRGEVIEKGNQSIVLDVQGVGYTIAVLHEHAYSLLERVDLYIYFQWTAENGPSLYGFNDSLSRTIFALIVSCPGCGPKIGLAVLATMMPQEFIRAVSVGDVKALNQVQGIGVKKAELMIMQLKDKVTKLMATGSPIDNTSLIKIKTVHEALAALRYNPSEITAALEFLNKNAAIDTSPIDELLKKGLSYLANR